MLFLGVPVVGLGGSEDADPTVGVFGGDGCAGVRGHLDELLGEIIMR